MPVATTKDDFVATLRRSGLLSDEQIDGFLAQSLAAADDPPALSRALLDANLITPWQRDKLLEGRYRGFFLGKYRLLAQLGAGAMGSVFLAEHKVMRHKVAIKVLARRLVGKDAYIRRFEQEARAAAAVNHPRVVRAFDFDSAGDTHYLVMEYAEGEDLQKIVLRDGVLPIAVAARCVLQTAEGLTAAHAAGLVHRDIKPSNLLVDRDGNVRILDLGLARIADENEPSLTLAHDAKMIGTVDFLAPEQARNSHHIDGRADLYSLGCTLYFLLTAQPPFNEGTLTQRVIEHQTKLPVDIRQRRKDCPAELAYICHKLLAKSPDDRFQSAQEVADAVADWLDRYEKRAAGGSSLLIAADGLEELPPLPTGDDLSILDETETMANLETTVPGSSSKGLPQGKSPSSHDDLALADDDVLASPPPTVSPSRGGSSKAGGSSIHRDSRPAPGASAIGKRAGNSGIGSAGKSGIGRAGQAAPSAAATDTPSAPLTSRDSLVELLESELPDALVSAAPLAGSSLLADPLGAPSAARGTQLPDAYQKALAEAQATRPRSWRETLRSLVVQDGPGGIAYSLWFLVLSGMLLGGIVCWIGYSYYHSTKAAEAVETETTDD